MELELDLTEIFVKVSDGNNKEEEYANVVSDDFVLMNRCYAKSNGKMSLDCDESTVKDDEMSRVGDDEEQMKFVNGSQSVECGTDQLGPLNSSVVREDEISRKRKRESDMDLLRWVTDVAKDPCDPSIGSLPERSKWKCYTNDVFWKQVLLLRDEMLLKKSTDTSGRCSIWEKKQKMHPSMYDDGSALDRVRSSQRVLCAKSPSKKVFFSASSPSSSPINEDPFAPVDSSADSGVGILCSRRRKQIPVGPQFQADIPEWRQEKYESDSKWLGTRIWPLDKHEQRRMLIERDPIGKGRQDSCGCQCPASLECVKFHLAEKRKKVKLELGSAFYLWKFNSMGEEVALSWTKEEEKKFQDIVKSNPSDKCFWNKIFKLFPNKNRGSLVSYYFNVFLLRLRGHQNRMTASIIDSDDEESRYGPKKNTFGRGSEFSIFCSPRKEHPDPR